MSIRVEIYGNVGVSIGVVAEAGPLRDAFDGGRDLAIDDAMWHPLDGSPPQARGSLTIALDDILVAVADEANDIPVHVQWHDVAVDIGPYRVTGQMPTMFGFDPGRALARPTGEFVLLKDVRIALVDDAAGTAVEQPAARVNRYLVDRVAADMQLGFFFPGATMVLTREDERGTAAATAEIVAPLAAAAAAEAAPGTVA
ncbi:MAG: hypothetical protein QOF49_2045 [Chloroflexota bacterium]|nr:hypothetical protein [Chloroflexota bacterium]